MAQRGYPVNPAEALDLVHDFYLEALPGLFKRYDQKRGRFSTYLYGAFLHFARPRIIRNLRWKGMLADLEAYASKAAEPQPDFDETLVASIARAWKALPATSRAVLSARIVEGLSERDTAIRLELSRYFARQHTAEGLGRLAIAIGEDRRIPEEVRPLALHLWRDGRPLMDVARELKLTRHEARTRYARMLRAVSSALLETPARPKRTRRS